MKVSTRADWGCPPATVQPLPTRTGMAIHYPGPGRFRFADHAQCLRQVKSWDAMHRARGSRMLEYGGVVCQHGYYIEGRGTWGNLLVRPGSQGTTQGNMTFASVQFMAGTLDAPPSDQEYRWLGEVVARARSQGLGRAVKGHRDFYPTACPGDAIQSNLGKIAAYADSGGGTPTPDPTTEEDTMKIIEAAGKGSGLYGPGYFKTLTKEERDVLVGQGVPYKQGNAREFDVIRAAMLQGKDAGK